jgi:hypothetical protein
MQDRLKIFSPLSYKTQLSLHRRIYQKIKFLRGQSYIQSIFRRLPYVFNKLSSCIFNRSGMIAIRDQWSKLSIGGDKVNSGGVNYVSQSGTMNLATCDNRKIWFFLLLLKGIILRPVVNKMPLLAVLARLQKNP